MERQSQETKAQVYPESAVPPGANQKPGKRAALGRLKKYLALRANKHGHLQAVRGLEKGGFRGASTGMVESPSRARPFRRLAIL